MNNTKTYINDGKQPEEPIEEKVEKLIIFIIANKKSFQDIFIIKNLHIFII